MVLDPIPQPLTVHFFGSRPQPPTSPIYTTHVLHNIEGHHIYGGPLYMTMSHVCSENRRSLLHKSPIKQTIFCNTCILWSSNTTTHCNNSCVYLCVPVCTCVYLCVPVCTCVYLCVPALQQVSTPYFQLNEHDVLHNIVSLI